MKKTHYTQKNFECRRSLGYLIRRLHNLVIPNAESLFADADITFSQWVVLVSLRDGLASTAAEVARHMDHDAGAITRLIDQMEKRGLVARRRSTKDRRVIHLEITPAGKALATSLTPRLIEFWNTTLTGFTQAEFETLLSLLTRLIGRLEEQPTLKAAS
ncbi:MAG TPA: MarR family transcriptional regulator [Rhizomicrobium sp.]|jgi:DNA-binding MarR family transcriptional regulator